MAQWAVLERSATVKLACQAFGISQTCYRYKAKLDAENNLIADWLVRLTNNQRNWGFGLCFLYLRNAKGFKWNHKRVYRIYRELERTCGSNRVIVWCGRNRCRWQCQVRSIRAGRWTSCMTSLPMGAASVC
jgi:hypothetical protein